MLANASLIGLVSCGSADEQLIGFDIDLAKAVGENLGVDVRFQEIQWDKKEIELSSGQIDLIWNGLTITEERREAMEISSPYMVNSQVIVAKKSFNSEIKSDTGLTVAFEKGSAGDDVFNNNDIFSSCTPVECGAQVNALTEALSGTSQLAIIDSVMARYYIASKTSYKDLQTATSYNLTDEYYGIAGRKGEKGFIAKVNEAPTATFKSGKTAQIANEYGLSASLYEPGDFASYAGVKETSSWESIKSKGYMTIGYTVFASIAYFK